MASRLRGVCCAVVASESHLDGHHRRTLDANIIVSGLLGKV